MFPVLAELYAKISNLLDPSCAFEVAERNEPLFPTGQHRSIPIRRERSADHVDVKFLMDENCPHQPNNREFSSDKFWTSRWSRLCSAEFSTLLNSFWVSGDSAERSAKSGAWAFVQPCCAAGMRLISAQAFNLESAL
eukprot:gnl/TRDRNA2_/TRDRNA2_160027_c0_seq4.p1 gnl/TRDRNA2_/TRDRNA2_160027_c0~~gnl/TRDRNA2_/TRDRNA2_160027_c0_seq4.p1  ORF type:complete len:137 (-),score=6.69 gnl/TRDRNA2_/TRDRNA2_160027_c0_seq4:50-460(-)